MARFRSAVWVLPTLIAIVIGAVVLVGHDELYASFSRPDGQYKVLVYRRVTWFARMPGQAGDAPGRVVLADRSGKALREAPVEMVQLVESVDWEDGGVQIAPFDEWTLSH